MSAIDFDTVKSRATGQWFVVLANLGVAKTSLTKKHGPCPACGGTDRFRFDNKDGRGTFFCNHCGAGDGFQLLQNVHGWDAKEALKRVAECLGVRAESSLTASEREVLEQQAKHHKEASERRERQSSKKNQKKIDAILKQATRIHWPMAHYFIHRGLNDLAGRVPSDLKAVPSLPYWHGGQQLGVFPAMIGIVRNLSGEVVTLHRTYLTPEGKKADVPEPKKLMPPALPGGAAGSAIQLYTPTDKLAITEGIETALAVHLSTGLPVWAAVSATMLEKVEIPDSVEEVYIMADKDSNGAGERSAHVLAERLIRDHRVKIVLPPLALAEGQKSVDWLDVYQLEAKTVNQVVKGVA